MNDISFGFPPLAKPSTDPKVLADIESLKQQSIKHWENHEKDLNEIVRITDKHHWLEQKIDSLTHNLKTKTDCIESVIDEMKSKPPPNLEKLLRFEKELEGFTSSFKLIE